MAKDNPKKTFESQAMIVGEPVHEYAAKTKSLANEVDIHKVEVIDEGICRRILTGLPPR